MDPTDTMPTDLTQLNGAASETPPPSPSLKPVTDAAAQEAARLGELTRHWLAQGADRYRTAAAQVRSEATAMNQRSQRYVREQPMKSLLFAAAAGAALTGLLALRRGRAQ